MIGEDVDRRQGSNVARAPVCMIEIGLIVMCA